MCVRQTSAGNLFEMPILGLLLRSPDLETLEMQVINNIYCNQAFQSDSDACSSLRTMISNHAVHLKNHFGVLSAYLALPTESLALWGCL